MDIRAVKTEADYDWALTEIAPYFTSEPALGSKAAARFDVLAALIEGYEATHWPIESADPVSAIRDAMNRFSFTQMDLGRLIGSRSRASEILNRKRALTMEQAWKLHQEWRIPAEILLRPSDVPISR